MHDREIIILCWYMIALFMIDFFEAHSFGLEACLATITVILIIYFRGDK